MMSAGDVFGADGKTKSAIKMTAMVREVVMVMAAGMSFMIYYTFW